jgi:hypothetical protein
MSLTFDQLSVPFAPGHTGAGHCIEHRGQAAAALQGVQLGSASLDAAQADRVVAHARRSASQQIGGGIAHRIRTRRQAGELLVLVETLEQRSSSR